MLANLADQQSAETWELFALQLMPDHVHVLGRLGSVLPMAEVARRFKGPLTPLLRARSICWEKGGYYDHRLRRDDDLAPTLRYMLTNPYRRGLVAWDADWPFWFCAPKIWAWFEPTTNNGRPFAEWMSEKSPGRDP